MFNFKEKISNDLPKKRVRRCKSYMLRLSALCAFGKSYDFRAGYIDSGTWCHIAALKPSIKRASQSIFYPL